MNRAQRQHKRRYVIREVQMIQTILPTKNRDKLNVYGNLQLTHPSMVSVLVSLSRVSIYLDTN